MKTIALKVKFLIGDVVYLRMNKEDDAGLVLGYSVGPEEGIIYRVGWGGGLETGHFGMELTDTYEPDFSRGDEEGV